MQIGCLQQSLWFPFLFLFHLLPSGPNLHIVFSFCIGFSLWSPNFPSISFRYPTECPPSLISNRQWLNDILSPTIHHLTTDSCKTARRNKNKNKKGRSPHLSSLFCNTPFLMLICLYDHFAFSSLSCGLIQPISSQFVMTDILANLRRNMQIHICCFLFQKMKILYKIMLLNFEASQFWFSFTLDETYSYR